MKLSVSPKHAGFTLLAFLREALPSYSSVKEIKRAIDAGKCRVSGRVERFSSTKIKAGDIVEITLKIPEKPKEVPVLFEDEWIQVVNKPSGMVSAAPLLVHRLDKETSGIWLIPKTEEALARLKGQFKDRKVEKNYLALADKRIEENTFTIDNALILKKQYDGGKIYGAGKGGKRAITHFRCLHRGKDATYISCTPETGRTHQIRVHLKEIGHPILGDYQYSKTFTCPYHAERLMLHAQKLIFTHPETGKEMIFEAPLPPDFEEAMRKVFGRVI